MSLSHVPPQTIGTPDEQLVALSLEAVENALKDVVKSDVSVLQDASLHILSAGGKRIRPRLLTLSYLALGGTDIEHIAPAAAAVELMHTASVVHDDINDHGVLRRGRPSVNALWGRTFALLTGDFLFTTVYRLMAPYGDLNIDLAAAATALVEGETLQASAVKENTFTREVYMRIIGLKTAALFQAATSIGAKLSNATTEHVQSLANFGYHVGLAFQIADDILDIVGDDEQLGKTSGIDLEQGRGFVATNQTNDNATVAEDFMEQMKSKLMGGDALQEARDQAKALVELSIQYLEFLPDSFAKRELIDLAKTVVDRSY